MKCYEHNEFPPECGMITAESFHLVVITDGQLFRHVKRVAPPPYLSNAHHFDVCVFKLACTSTLWPNLTLCERGGTSTTLHYFCAGVLCAHSKREERWAISFDRYVKQVASPAPGPTTRSCRRYSAEACMTLIDNLFSLLELPSGGA